jgi:hypothetical protein
MPACFADDDQLAFHGKTSKLLRRRSLWSQSLDKLNQSSPDWNALQIGNIAQAA